MKNKAFKLALTIVIVGVLVFGASFAKADTNEEMIKTLQSLVQMLVQMVAQLQAQLAQKITTTTTIPTPNIRYSCTTARGTILTNWYSTCIPDSNGTFSSLEECQKICGATSGCTVTDSDGGMNIYIKGTASNGIVSKTDECTQRVWNGQAYQYNVVNTCTGDGCYVEEAEAACLTGAEQGLVGIVGKGGSGQADHQCPNGCQDGACKISTPPTTIVPACSESDGGKNYNVKGTVIYGSQTYTDACIDSRTAGCPAPPTPCPPSQIIHYVQEYYCENGVMKQELHDCGAGYTCQDGACKISTPPTTIVPACSESDGGNNYYVKGSCYDTTIGKTWYDYCDEEMGGTLKGGLEEVSCKYVPIGQGSPGIEGKTVCVYSGYICAYGCKNGTCLPTLTPTCTDSDGGKNYYVKGWTQTNEGWDVPSLSFWDKCISTNILKEWYCENDVIKSVDYTCPSGYTCQDGACTPTSQQCVTNSFISDPPTVHWNSSSTSSTNFSILSWSASNCTSCHVTSGSVGYWPTNNSSSVTIYNIKNTTTFTLECSGQNNTATKQLTVTVIPSSMNDLLNKLSASLISLIELLKR